MDEDESKYLSPPGEPYLPADLQRQFNGMTPRDVYALLAKRQGCKCVRSVLEALPNRLNGWSDITSLDLSRSYVGARGALAVIELCKLLGDLKYISLADNYVDNKTVWCLSKMALFHPTLDAVDVSNNPISWTGGMCLLELASRNTLIQSIITSDTLIKPKVADYIAVQIRRNVAMRNRQSRKGPNPSNHPITIRQRALKRLFSEILENEKEAMGAAGHSKEDRIPKKFIVDGLKEAWRLGGREAEMKQRQPEFFEKTIERCPMPMISWDIFMLLSMSEDIVYNSEYVAKLRFVFQAFDVDGAGYIEAKDLEAILTCLNDGRPPTTEEVEAKRSFYDIDNTMSVQWDEFLLMMYDLGPSVGKVMNANTSTPLEEPRVVVH